MNDHDFFRAVAAIFNTFIIAGAVLIGLSIVAYVVIYAMIMAW